MEKSVITIFFSHFGPMVPNEGELITAIQYMCGIYKRLDHDEKNQSSPFPNSSQDQDSRITLPSKEEEKKNKVSRRRTSCEWCV